jgi:uncharacterized protein YegP (UPF0339 family)
VILTSEAYESRSAAVKGITSVKKNAGNDKRFERKEAKDGSRYFVMKAANGEPIGKSEMYKTGRARENGIASIAKHAPDAPVADSDTKPAAKPPPKAAAKSAAKPAAKAAAKSAAKPAAKAAAKPAAKKAVKSSVKPAAKSAVKPPAKKAAKPAAKKAAKKK